MVEVCLFGSYKLAGFYFMARLSSRRRAGEARRQDRLCGLHVRHTGGKRGETDIAGVYVFTQRLATRRAAGPVAEAEGGVAVGFFERGPVPIAQRGNPREDVEDLLRSARFNRSRCTVTRALLDLMLEMTPLRLSRGACLDQVVRPRCQHRTAAAAAMA
jgi:molybdate-binding protein